ncbi:hypothetical protein FF36_01117 [Frankia torreyi]|uniref:Uncharacterized protein n=1 Tax=Frankia torreyi TaxID=1856 RepID=A0A0D8BJZ5_9ACTN|nr:hypothetical protein FF36_01117 [Frankia torreyi]KQM02317.1 hypothetical protein FF86_10717 [Frankia sp. CpI1-P]
MLVDGRRVDGHPAARPGAGSRTRRAGVTPGARRTCRRRPVSSGHPRRSPCGANTSHPAAPRAQAAGPGQPAWAGGRRVPGRCPGAGSRADRPDRPRRAGRGRGQCHAAHPAGPRASRPRPVPGPGRRTAPPPGRSPPCRRASGVCPRYVRLAVDARARSQRPSTCRLFYLVGLFVSVRGEVRSARGSGSGGVRRRERWPEGSAGPLGLALRPLRLQRASDLRRCVRVTLVEAEGARDTWRSKSARPLFTRIMVLL